MAAYTAPIKYFQQNTNASFWQKFRLFDLQWLRFSIFFFYLNLPECDSCTGILISHYLIASIFLKIRSQNWSKVCNFSCNIGTCNTYVRLFSQRFFLQFLTDTSGRKKFVLGNYLNVSTNSSHSQNKQKDSFHQIFPT